MSACERESKSKYILLLLYQDFVPFWGYSVGPWGEGGETRHLPYAFLQAFIGVKTSRVRRHVREYEWKKLFLPFSGYNDYYWEETDS